MKGVGGGGDGGGKRIGVDAKEVADIDKPSVVLVIDGAYQCLNALGGLENIAVVFGAGADSSRLGILGNTANGGGHNADGILPGEGAVLGERIANIVAHDPGAKRLGDIDAAAQPIDLGVLILGEQICTDGVGYYLEPDFIAMSANLLGTRQRVVGDVEGGEIEIHEFNALKAEFLG